MLYPSPAKKLRIARACRCLHKSRLYSDGRNRDLVVCGVLSCLAYAAVHLGSPAAVVGASGAVSGLMGAAARLIAGDGRIGRILSAPVLGMGGAWLAVNLLVGAIGSQFVPGAGGAGIAWEAHVAGFLAGVLLITPFAWVFRRA